jgi:hypothetical protein
MKNKFLFLLLLGFFVLLRLYPIWRGNFPYSYDNAKDSLALLQMWVSAKPMLLGAVTSMEGLCQGPACYYIFFPLNLILGFAPIASVVTVIALGGFTLWLFWKYIGKFAALIYAVSPMVILTQQTAWSPYLPMISTAWGLIVLTLVRKKATNLQIIILAISLALTLHSEIAFGVVFAVSIAVWILARKIRISISQFAIAVFVILVSLIPQGIFELRHDFLQTRSVVNFVSDFGKNSLEVGKNQSGLGRFIEVGKAFGENVSVTVVPWFVFFVLMIFGFKNNREEVEFILPFILVPFVLYLFIPFKSYYLVALAPFWIYLFAKFIQIGLGRYVKPISFIVILLALYQMNASKTNFENLAKTSRILFAPKLAAVNKAYELSEEKPFTSYQFVPEVYDYTYQFIYQYTSLKEKREVPVEYSYAPGEENYMQTSKIKYSGGEAPTNTILIVEKGDNEILFDTWWNNMIRGKNVLSEEKINDLISVYKLDR